MEGDFFRQLPVAEMLDQLNDGVILFRDGRAVAVNKRAVALLGVDPTGRTLFTILGSADVDLLHPDAESALIYHLQVGERWLTLTLRHLQPTVSMAVLREDIAPPSHVPYPMDEDDLTWLRVIAARLAFFSELHQKMTPEELSFELRRYADQLEKYVNNGFLRSITDPTYEAVFPIVGIAFPSLLAYVKESIGDKLDPIGVILHYTPLNQNRSGVIFASLQFFVRFIYTVIDTLIFHCKEEAPKHFVELTLGEGEIGEQIYLRFHYAAARPFPVDQQTLSDYLLANPAAFPPSYASNVKFIWAFVKLYHGIFSAESRRDRHELRIYFQRSPAALSAPYSPADCQVYPETEFSDTIHHPNFQVDR